LVLCIRLRPEYPGHVWAYDFVEERIHDGRKFRILTIIDEASRECLALVVSRQLRHEDVLAALAELFIERGPPAHIRSDNGSEFIATAVQTWLGQIGVKTLYIAPGPPWENGYNESLASPPFGSTAPCGRAPQWRDLLQPRRGQGADRSLAPALQHRSAAQQPRLPTTGTKTATPPSPASGSLHLRPAMAAETTMQQLSDRTTQWGLLTLDTPAGFGWHRHFQSAARSAPPVVVHRPSGGVQQRRYPR